jgi:hypothetical protein
LLFRPIVEIQQLWFISVALLLTLPSFLLNLWYKYILQHIMTELRAYDGDYLEGDFEALDTLNGNSRDTDLLRTFLNLLDESQDLLWKLTKRDDASYEHPKFNCKAIDCFQKKGYFVYRIRPFFEKLGCYRILYVYDGQDEAIHYLSVVKKKNGVTEESYNYEEEHPISLRIFDEYDRSGFPRGRS